MFQGKCHNGHAMKATKGNVRSTAHCDICRFPMKDCSPGDTLMAYCSICDFDVCSLCEAAASAATSVVIVEGSYVGARACDGMLGGLYAGGSGGMFHGLRPKSWTIASR